MTKLSGRQRFERRGKFLERHDGLGSILGRSSSWEFRLVGRIHAGRPKGTKRRPRSGRWHISWPSRGRLQSEESSLRLLLSATANGLVGFHPGSRTAPAPIEGTVMLSGAHGSDHNAAAFYERFGLRKIGDEYEMRRRDEIAEVRIAARLLVTRRLAKAARRRRSPRS